MSCKTRLRRLQLSEFQHLVYRLPDTDNKMPPEAGCFVTMQVVGGTDGKFDAASSKTDRAALSRSELQRIENPSASGDLRHVSSAVSDNIFTATLRDWLVVRPC